MCGIAGIIDCGAGFGRDRLVELAVAMPETMVHRGPDDAGVWSGGQQERDARLWPPLC